MSSLYKQYVEEKTSKSILEDDYGFVTYSFIQPDTCYIEDVYIVPDYRRSNAASDYGDRIAEIAKAKGCTKLLGSVRPSTKDSTHSLQFLFAYGFRLLSVDHDIIFVTKDIA